MQGRSLDYKWQVAIVAALGLFMAVLDNTIVSVALPQMQQAFKTDFSTITWVATAYFLAQAAIIPVTGYFTDKVGARPMFLIALTIFTIGSALCAVAPTEQWLIGFRVLQGIGGGGLFPVAFALIYRVFPASERGPASAAIGVPVLLAPAFGPTIGGYLTTTFDWSAIFTVNIPIGILTLILAFWLLRKEPSEQVELAGVVPSKKNFDVLGLILVMVGCTVLLYGISEASSHGWGDPLVYGSMIVGAVLLIAFVITELLVSDPVMDVRLFLNYSFAASNFLTWLLAALLFGSLFLIPYFFENVQKQRPLDAGVFLIAQGLSSAVGVLLSGILYNRIGPRIMVVSGFLLVCVGTIGLTRLDVSTTGLSLQGWLIMRGLGLGLSNIPLQTLAISSISNRAMARASSLINVTRQIFGAVGIAVLSTYFAQQASGYGTDVASAFKAFQIHKQPLTGVAATCGPLLRQGSVVVRDCVQQHVLVMGLNDTFIVVAIGSGIGILLAFFIGRDPAVEEAKRARARGEEVEVPQPSLVAE